MLLPWRQRVDVRLKHLDFLREAARLTIVMMSEPFEGFAVAGRGRLSSSDVT